MIVATGGYPVRLARERGLLVRSNPWSEGDGIALALERGATEAPSGEFYGRAMPGPVPEQDFVRRLPALRPLRAARERPRRGVLPRRGLVVGERPGAGDRRPAGRPSLVRARPGGAREARGRREAPVRAGDGAAPGRRPARPRLRGGHAHVRRRRDRHACPRRRRRVGCGRGCGPDLERRLLERPCAGARPRARRRRGCRDQAQAGQYRSSSTSRSSEIPKWCAISCKTTRRTCRTSSSPRVQPLERPAVDRDLVRRHGRVRARAHGQRDALVEAEQRQPGRRLVLDDDRRRST